MKRFKASPADRFMCCLFAALTLLPPRVIADTPPSATGANVDENKVTKILYVDPAHIEAADDDKHGAADAPFATLNYACQTAVRAKDANIGIKIVLANGSYREAAEIPAPSKGKADTDAPLVIEAAERDQAVVDGADTEGWSPSTWKIEGNRWTHPWPFHRGMAPPHRGKAAGETPGEAPLLGDLLFVNGAPVQQLDDHLLLATDNTWEILAASGPGTKRSGARAGALAVVQPPPDTELPGSIIQVGVRRRGLTITGRRNVVVRGLLLQHAAEPGGTGEKTAGLALEGCANVLIEDVLSQWNDGAGLRVDGDSSDVTLRRVKLLHNGLIGLAVTAKNVLAEDCEASFNDFRGEWSARVLPFPVAGVSVSGAWNVTFRRLREVGNFAPGLAVSQGGNLILEDSVLRNNVSAGVFSRSEGGSTLIRRCVVTDTKEGVSTGKDPMEIGGVILGSTPNVTLQANVLAGNAGAQLLLRATAESVPPGEPAHHVYRHNVFFGMGADQFLWILSEAPSVKGTPAEYFRTLDLDENCFWNPATAEAFATVGPAGQRLGEGLTLERWREFLSTRAGLPPVATDAQGKRPDTHSLWQDPLFVDPVEGDFRLKKGSAVADWDLPSDDASTGQ